MATRADAGDVPSDAALTNDPAAEGPGAGTATLTVPDAGPADRTVDRGQGAPRPAIQISSEKKRLAGTAALSILLAVSVPFWATDQFTTLFAQSCVYVVAILSVVVLYRATGSISLCQATFMGIGAYAFAFLYSEQGWSLGAAAPIGAVTAALVGSVLAFPALRMRGLELTVLTLSVGLAASALVFLPDSPLSYNVAGATLDVPATPFGLDLFEPNTMYWFQLGIVLLAFAIVAGVLVSPLGATWRAMRSGNAAAASSGIRITRYQLAGFGLSALLAGIAGVMLLLYQNVATSDSFGAGISIQLVVFAMLSGLDRIRTAILGGFAYGAGQLVFTMFGIEGDALNVVFGFLLVVAIVIRGRAQEKAAR
jgi:ABC-type branched-subunit amino acid transport system permease subunit